MACFSLTGAQRALLASCIQIGWEGAMENTEETGGDNQLVDMDAIEALMDELQASNNPIEITVMVDENAEPERPAAVQALLDAYDIVSTKPVHPTD